MNHKRLFKVQDQIIVEDEVEEQHNRKPSIPTRRMKADLEHLEEENQLNLFRSRK
mgnify:CR=1 FL=1|tara:strand:- start:1904 stop:2068 length:165 start_codon:yes stop_codon:yes gene_type:complete